MRGWAITLTTLSLASGCAISPGNGTSHLLSINYSLLRRPAVVYEQFEHRPPHRDRVEYYRWLHGAPIDPYDVTAMMSTPAKTEWQVGPDPSPNAASRQSELMMPPVGGHSLPMSTQPSNLIPVPSNSMPPASLPIVQPQPAVEVPATTAPPVPSDNSWLQLFPDPAKNPPTSNQPPVTPPPPVPNNPVQQPNQPLFPDTIPPLAPKPSSTEGNVTPAVYQTARPLSQPATNNATRQPALPQPSRVSSRILFPSR